jgi:hypothetical protein
MFMAELLIDLNQAGLDLEPAELEAFSLRLVDELRGDLAEDARLVREDEVPEGAMSGAGAFIVGILKVEAVKKNIGKLLGWLWTVRPNTTQKITYKKNGSEVVLEYRTSDQLQEQIAALKDIDSFMIQLIQTK